LIKRIWGYWYTLFLILFLISAGTGLLEQFIPQVGWNESPIQGKLFVVIALTTVFGFWFLMLGDFFSNKDVKRPVLVGFSLFFFSWLAILIYFWSVVSKRERNEVSANEKFS